MFIDFGYFFTLIIWRCEYRWVLYSRAVKTLWLSTLDVFNDHLKKIEQYDENVYALIKVLMLVALFYLQLPSPVIPKQADLMSVAIDAIYSCER